MPFLYPKIGLSMLVFIVPLKSQRASNSWERVSEMFERCIQSICNQTSANFRVIVVYHERPQIEFTHPHIQYLEVDFPPPSLPDLRSKRVDKTRKGLLGLIAAGELEPSHVMQVDADDCISKHLVEFVTQYRQSNGWFLQKGYVYTETSKSIYITRAHFHEWCGSCNILRYDLHDVIQQNLQNFPQTEEEYYQYYRHYHHEKVVERMAERGTPIKPLPFVGAVYTLGNSENIHPTNSQRLIKPTKLLPQVKSILVNLRPLTPKIRGEFGLYDVGR